jgi:Leucine-rich repeat (LRR) protein
MERIYPTLDDCGVGITISSGDRDGNPSDKNDATTTVTARVSLSNIEREWLCALYRSTHGENWSQQEHWNDNESELTDWYGITVEDGKVTAVELPGNQLDGALPPFPAAPAFEALRFLRLRHNSISGPLPEIGALKALEVLDLEHNMLCGSIPPTIACCEGLEALYLGNNRLSGSIPTNLDQLWRMVDINLNANMLSGRLPLCLKNLTNLRGLAVDNNRLSGPIPLAVLRCLKQVRVLHLHNNEFVGAVDFELATKAKDQDQGQQVQVQGVPLLPLSQAGRLLREELPDCDVVIELPQPQQGCCMVQ